jgi:AcrR family transcriptional regulator
MPTRESQPGDHNDDRRRASRRPAASTSRAGAAGDDAPRTRGGWTPAGTAAERRAVHTERGTARGERTRRQIIDAARRVFERDGYLDVGVAGIAREAGVAHGSFYTYFTSKQDVFRIVCGEAAELVNQAVRQRGEGEQHLDPVDALCQSNLRYIRAYRQNARIYALIEQLGQTDKELHQAWNEWRYQQTVRVRDLIRRWQAQGLADPSVAPTPTAAALISMTSNICYCLFVMYDEERGFGSDEAGAAVNHVWIRAVDLRRSPNRLWLGAADEHLTLSGSRAGFTISTCMSRFASVPGR